jgi:hypothetical protein
MTDINGNFQNGDNYCWLISFKVLLNYNKTGNVHNIVAHLRNHCSSRSSVIPYRFPCNIKVINEITYANHS